MNNIAEVKLGLVAVSRDCFPVKLSERRRKAVMQETQNQNLPVIELETIVEGEKDVVAALAEISAKKINALIIYLGNFGPEGPTTLLAQNFSGPVMFCAAAEESKDALINGRGDAYCGLLNASYNIGLRKLKVHIPEYPVGTAPEIVTMIKEFIPVARAVLSIKKVKIFSFGPRPQDFLACNAPIKPLYDLGVEIMENSELDLYDIFLKAKGDPEIDVIVQEMQEELGEGNTYPDMLKKLAQYEVALTKFYRDHLGCSEFGVFAIKCWPSFEEYFGFVPCFLNSRLASKGIPVSCEVDIYGVLSEYIVTALTELPATILDINNTVPYDMIEGNKEAFQPYRPTDLFMGFHCGNTPIEFMEDYSIKYQLIMHRLLEEGKAPDITRGTLEGKIKSGPITIFRLQSTADTRLCAYMAEGEVLDVDPQSFGGIGVFAVPEMGRFYRHVLIGKRYPHHTAVAFKHAGKSMYSLMKLLGIEDISYNRPKNERYPRENPF